MQSIDDNIHLLGVKIKFLASIKHYLKTTSSQERNLFNNVLECLKQKYSNEPFIDYIKTNVQNYIQNNFTIDNLINMFSTEIQQCNNKSLLQDIINVITLDINYKCDQEDLIQLIQLILKITLEQNNCLERIDENTK